MIPVDIGHVYPKGDVDIRFDSTPRFVSTGSMFLDGADDYLDLDGLTVTTSSADYSFSFWFKTVDGTSDHRFFGIQNSGNSDRINLQMNATTITSYSLSSAGNTSTTFSTSFVAGFEDGTWHHAALVITSGTGVVLYLDGQLVTASQTMRNVDLSANGLFAVGSGYDGNPATTVSGGICHFGVWHAALTQAQVRDLMTATTYAEAITKGGSTPRAYFLLESNATDSVGAITYTTSSSTSGTLTNGAVIVGDRARLPSGYDLSMTDGVPNQMSARCFSGRAVAFDGTGDKISCGTTLGDDLGDNYAGSFSVSFWAKNSENDGSNNDGVHELNGAGDSNHGTHAAYYFNSTIRFALDGNAWYRACDLVGVEWHHFVMVYTAGSESDSKVYIDGLEVSGTTSGTFPAAADLDFAGDTLHLGLHYAAATDLNGSISDWKFFKIALTAAQALELYQNPEQILPTGATAANLRSWYPLADYDIATGDNLLGGLYVQDCGALKANGLCTGVGTEFSQPTIPQLGLRSSSSRILFQTAQEVTISSAAGINVFSGADGGGTVAFWMFVNSDGEDNSGRVLFKDSKIELITRNESSGTCELKLEVPGFSGGSANHHSPKTVNIGQWNHVVMTYTGLYDANPIFYINNATASNTTDTQTTGTFTDTGDLLLGDHVTAARSIDGILSEVAFWSSILDADAIAVLYNSGVQGFDPTSDSGNYDVAADLTAFYKLDNPATIQDLTANDNDGTVSGTPNMATIPEGSTEGLSALGSLTTTRLGSFALNLDGTSYAALDDGGTKALNPVTAGWSMSVWFRMINLGNGNPTIIVDRDTSNDRWHLKVRDDAGDTIQFNFGDGSGKTDIDGPAVTDNDWHHVGITLDYGNDIGRIFVDGAKHGSDVDISARTADCPADGILGIGGNAGADQKLFGAVGGLKIYNATLADNVMLSLYQSGIRFVKGDS